MATVEYELLLLIEEALKCAKSDTLGAAATGNVNRALRLARSQTMLEDALLHARVAHGVSPALPE